MKKIICLLCIALFYIEMSMSIEVDALNPNDEIQIRAKRIEILEDKNIAFLIGNVLITQNALKFRADKMDVKYIKQKNGDFIIKMISAKNNVKISDKSVNIRGDIGVYDFIKNKITLEKNVIVYDGLSKVYGNKLEYDVLNETFSIVGNGQNKDKQVHIVIDDIDKMEEYYDNRK